MVFHKKSVTGNTEEDEKIEINLVFPVKRELKKTSDCIENRIPTLTPEKNIMTLQRFT